MATFKNILITGGAGFVGSHMSIALARAYPQAARVALIRPGESGGHPAFEAVSADLLDEAAIDRLVEERRPDLVVHLAGQSSITEAAKSAEQTWRVNFHGSFALGSAVARYSPKAVFLFASSAQVYGLTFREGVLTEDAPLRPLDIYGRSKVAAEGALADLLGPEARLIVARPVNHSGPGQRSRNFVISAFAAQIAAMEAGRAEPKLRVGDLSKARDFLDVRDVVDAYMGLIAAARDLPDPATVFNVGSGEARSIASLLDVLRERASVAFEVEIDPKLLRPSAIDIPSVACDASRLRAATGWSPRHCFDDMVQELLDEWRAEHASGRA